jgi:hypothetical protein
MFNTFSVLRRASTSTYTATLSGSGEEDVKQVNYRTDLRVPILRFLQSLKRNVYRMNNWIQRMWFLSQFLLFVFLFVRAFFVFLIFAACSFITLCSSCFLCMCRVFACETLGGELRRMTWTLGIMTLFGRYLAVLHPAHSLIYSSLFIFCFLFHPTLLFLLFSASFSSIYYPHIPSLQKCRISLTVNDKLNYGNLDYKGFTILRSPEWHL